VKRARERPLRLLCEAAFIAVVFTAPSFAGVELTAEVDRAVCRVGERITYTVTVSGGSTLPDLAPADYDGFEIVMGPSTSTSIQMVNGRVTQTSTLEYVFRARRTGTLTIGPARLKKGRKVYTSNVVTVQVSDRNSGQPRTPAPAPGGKVKPPRTSPNVFLVAEADKDTVYRNEMVLVTYKLYLRVNVVSYNIVNLPQATGFWVEEFSTPSRPYLKDVTVGGRSYKEAVIRKVGMFPTRTGRLTVDPLTADVTVEQRSRRRRSWDPFGSIWDDPFFSTGRRKVVTISTDPLDITVRPLPSIGRPPDFHGDVGSFNLKVSYDKREVTQHDALTIKISIGGTGYIKSVDPPELELPDGFEMFNPTVDENVTVDGYAMRGKKTFTYLVIPRVAGDFDLPEVKFSYFDPGAERYRTLRDGGLRLRVLPAKGVAAGVARNPEDVTLLGRDIRFIKGMDTPLFRATGPAYRTVWFFVLLGLAPVLFLLGVGVEKVVERRFSDPDLVRRRRAPERLKRSLNLARKRLKHKDPRAAVDIAVRGFTELAGAVVREPAAGLTSDLLEAKLKAAGADEELRREVIHLLGESDRIRFGEFVLSAGEAEAILDRLARTAAKLEKL